MLLDISEIIRTISSSYKFEIDEPELPLGGLQLASPIGGHITVSNSGSRLLVRGNAWGDVVLECGRCLKPFIYPVDAEIEEDFEMREVKRLASRKRVDDETMKALFVGPAIDLNELITQEFTLALPINPVCSAECDPPCVECGEPGSVCKCRSHEGAVDPRWEPLRERLQHSI